MRGAWLPVFVLLLPVSASAQQALSVPGPAAPHFELTPPEMTFGAVSAVDPSRRWSLPPLTLNAPPLLETTFTALAPLQTGNGELSSYVASTPVVADSDVTLSAEGTVTPKLELNCDSNCQRQVEGSLALEARVVIAGKEAEPAAALFLRAEQAGLRPSSERRLRLGVLGVF